MRPIRNSAGYFFSPNFLDIYSHDNNLNIVVGIWIPVKLYIKRIYWEESEEHKPLLCLINHVLYSALMFQYWSTIFTFGIRIRNLYQYHITRSERSFILKYYFRRSGTGSFYFSSSTRQSSHPTWPHFSSMSQDTVTGPQSPMAQTQSSSLIF